MTMQTVRHSEYRGATIYRQWGGYALPWTAFVPDNGALCADTLAGLKALIRSKVDAH